MNRWIVTLLLASGLCSAASLTVSSVADPGGSVNLTTLGTLDWAHYGYPGAGTGSTFSLDNLGQMTTKTGGTVLNTPTTSTGIFKFYNFSPNTYIFSDGTPNASASFNNGMVTNDALSTGAFTEILLTAAASTSPTRLVVYLGTYFFGGSQPDPLATLTASLNDGSGSSFTINNLQGRQIVTIDYTANAASLLTVSLGSTALRNGGGPENLILDAAYVQAGPASTGAPEPATGVLFAAGALATVAWKRRQSPK
jgi:hypothetical protein